MYVVIMRDAYFLGSRVSYYLARRAETPTEALDSAKADLEDWALEKLEAGSLEIEILECTARWQYVDGQIRPNPIR